MARLTIAGEAQDLADYQRCMQIARGEAGIIATHGVPGDTISERMTSARVAAARAAVSIALAREWWARGRVRYWRNRCRRDRTRDYQVKVSEWRDWAFRADGLLGLLASTNDGALLLSR